MGFFDSSSTTTDQTTAYGPAKGYMDAAIGNLGSQQWSQYGGPWAASQNPFMTGAGTAGYNMGQGLLGQGQQMFGAGSQGYQDMLGQMQNTGPRQFSYDQGTANQVMNQLSGGMTSSANLQGLLSQRNLDSQLGQLMGAAGTTGQFGSSLSSKLAGGAASANALSQQALQGNIQNMYGQAAQGAANAGMSAGGQNLNSAIGRDSSMLSGYGNMMNMGLRSQGAGLGAMRQAGMDQFGYDKYKTQAGLDQYNNNLFGQQSFYANQLNPLANVGQAFGTRTSTQTQSPSGMQNLASVAGLAGSVFGGMGGMSGLSSLFGGGGGGTGMAAAFGQGANMNNNGYYTGQI